MRIADLAEFNAVREAGLAKLTPDRPRIAVGMGTCGTGNGAEGVHTAFKSAIEARGLDIALAPVGCFGFCAEEPLVNVWIPGSPLLMLRRVQPEHDASPSQTPKASTPNQAIETPMAPPRNAKTRLSVRTCLIT